MRSLVVILALLGPAGAGVCAADEEAAPVRAAGSTSVPLLSLLGETRDLDQIAVEGAWHLPRGRLSVFAGLGYLPRDDEDPRLRLPGIRLFEGGMRVHTGWFRRRGYVELGWGPLARAVRTGPQGLQQYLVYGPSLLLGYQQIAKSHLTFLAAAGYCYTWSSENGGAVHNPEFRIGLGYTWRSRARALPGSASTR
jgi:hypothetical protein